MGVMLSAALGFSLAIALPTFEHPVHAARAELATAPDGRIIATILVYEEDFGPGRDLERVATYLTRTFTLRDGEGVRVAFKVLHARPIGDRLRITLCSRASHDLAGGSAHLTILHEQFDDQVNVLIRHLGADREEFVFVPGDPATALP